MSLSTFVRQLQMKLEKEMGSNAILLNLKSVHQLLLGLDKQYMACWYQMLACCVFTVKNRVYSDTS